MKTFFLSRASLENSNPLDKQQLRKVTKVGIWTQNSSWPSISVSAFWQSSLARELSACLWTLEQQGILLSSSIALAAITTATLEQNSIWLSYALWLLGNFWYRKLKSKIPKLRISIPNQNFSMSLYKYRQSLSGSGNVSWSGHLWALLRDLRYLRVDGQLFLYRSVLQASTLSVKKTPQSLQLFPNLQ